MKIDKEKFNELSQLDRIEFRQKDDRIESAHNPLSGKLLLLCSGLMGFYMLLIVGLTNLYKTTENFELLKIIPIIGEVLVSLIVILIILGIIYDFISYYFKKKYIQELDEEYFEIKVKKKRK